ncbi:MAG TPA: HIT family protein [Candidatus Dormibacteraeota bacterium]|nr:HIT family protein [Candidatus Dormibacteraeota bacterium]
MASVFTRIINGELPARFVWQDEQCVAFLSNRPLRPGHTLVVSRLEVDHWLDVDPQLLAHLTKVSQRVGRAQMAAFKPTRIGVMIAGLEVPHLHIHVVPIRGMHDLDFGNQDPNPDPKMMDEAADSIRSEMQKLG